MLNREEILIKVMQVLDFDMNDINLKQSAEKKRFVTLEESSKKTKEHIQLICEHLNLEEVDNQFINVFQDLIYLYEQIESKLLFRLDKAYEKKLNWIILKRLVIPYLAYRFANMDVEYNNRIDKGMSGGKFWYLPDTIDSQEIKMPIKYIMKWWLDLYGKGLDSLCFEIDKNSKESQAFSSKDILNPWLYKDTLPSRKSLELYLNKDIIYTGVFEEESTAKVSMEFEKAKEFVRQKKLTLEALKNEIPEYTFVDKIFTNKKSILRREKQKFISLIADRWANPTKKSLITKFLIARAVQDSYKKLMDYFGIKKDSVDIEENKVLQLIHEYEILYNIELEKRTTNYLEDILKNIEYEFLSPFNRNDFENIIKTIHSDINIELKSPLVEETELENIYIINAFLATKNNDMKLFEKSIRKLEEFDKYFRLKHDTYEQEILKYLKLSDNAFSLRLDNENNFESLFYLFHAYKLTEYDKEEKVCLRMLKLAKNIDEELKTLLLLLDKYTRIDIKENRANYITTKHLIEQYLKLSNKDEISNEIKAKILSFQIGFHLKAKEFEESLNYCDEYFNEFIDKKKKEDIHEIIVLISAYCAYRIGNEVKLKKYNKFLKKYCSRAFKNEKSLPFSIYFYK